MDTIKQNFGSNLKKIRRSKKLTQEQLAEKIDLNQRQLTRIETGRSFPSFATLDLLCDALNVEPIALFDFSNCIEVMRNGTDGTVHYVGKTKGNVIYLNNCIRSEAQNNTQEMEIGAEDDMIKMAKNINQVIKVDYFDEKSYLRTVLYYPNGEVEYKNIQNDINNNDILIRIKDEISRYENSIQKLKFIELAIKSLNDKNSAEKLRLMLDGMLL